MSEQAVAIVRELITHSLSPDNAVRKLAEDHLKAARNQAGFLLTVLHLIGSASHPHDAALTQGAAIYFKNSVKQQWSPEEDSDLASIPQTDRETIKTHLIDLMCMTSPNVQKQLAEGVSIISKYDYPDAWASLLPQLVQKLQVQDWHQTKGVMITANSIMKRYRNASKTDQLLLDLKSTLMGFQAPLLETYQKTYQAVEMFAGNRDNLLTIFETLRLMTRIFYSLNWQDLPEFFEDNMSFWMQEFLRYLRYRNPILVDASETTEPGAIDKLHAAVIENLSLYASKYEEEFTPYIGEFTQAIWQLLLEVGPTQKHDILASSGIKFLSSVSSKQMNVGMFSPEVLKNIVEQIVIRNLTASQDDEELFEDNPTDYIRKDMEGSDQDTRRRCAIELVRNLLKFFAESTSRLCVDYIGAMLAQYHASRDWRAKDAALHLVLAVAVLSMSAAGSAVNLNPQVNILDLFGTHVLPEVHDADVNSRPIVKADSIKLICIFRPHLQGPFMLDLIPHIIRHLSSEHVVIQTYAAMCIERFLTVKDRSPSGESVPRLTKEHLAPHLEPLFRGLFLVLDNPDVPENDYVMKCIMRTLALMGPDVAPVVGIVLPKLTGALERVCRNPSNPHFNHYLFECLALLIRATCCVPNPSAAAAACSQFEAALFPHLQLVLAQNVEDFFPYVFQIFAQLLSGRGAGAGLSDPYRALFVPLLAPTLWLQRTNVPSLADLIRAYLRVGAAELCAGGHLQALLGIFQQLLSVQKTEVQAFKLLEAIFTFSAFEAFGAHVGTILGLCLGRLQTQMQKLPAPRIGRLFIHVVLLLAAGHGAQRVYEALEQVQVGLVTALISHILPPNCANCATADPLEVQQMVVGATKLLCDTPVSTNPEVWGRLLKSIAVLLGAESSEALQQDTGEEVLGMLDEGGEREFDSTYSRLAYAQVPEPPPSPEVADSTAYFTRSLAALFARQPGQYQPVLLAALTPAEQASLQAASAKSGVRLL